MHLPASLSLLLPVLALAAACDDGDTKKSEDRRAVAAEAMLGAASEHDVAREKEAEELKVKFAERKAKEDAEAARVAGVLADIVKLPDQMPRNLTAACDAVLEQFHEFQVKVNHDDDGALLAWYEVKAKTLGERRAKCMKIDSVEAAACQASALAAAPADFLGHDLTILSACVEKFAPEKAAEAAAAEPAMPKQ